jgi:hypothetical protein
MASAPRGSAWIRTAAPGGHAARRSTATPGSSRGVFRVPTGSAPKAARTHPIETAATRLHVRRTRRMNFLIPLDFLGPLGVTWPSLVRPDLVRNGIGVLVLTRVNRMSRLCRTSVDDTRHAGPGYGDGCRRAERTRAGPPAASARKSRSSPRLGPAWRSARFVSTVYSRLSNPARLGGVRSEPSRVIHNDAPPRCVLKRDLRSCTE